MLDGQVVGVDVGATKTIAARIRGIEVLASTRAATRAESAGDLLALIVDSVIRVDAPEVSAIGVCLPTVVGHDRRVLSGAEIPLLGIDIERELTSRLGRPALVENDGNTAAYAESFRADGTRARHLVMMTIGTGIGGGLIVDGRIYRGATGAAGEIGQMIIDGASELRSAALPPSFPRPGALERLASGSALDRLARSAMAEDSRLPPLTGAGRGAAPDGLALWKLAQTGDPSAVDAFQEVGQLLGLAAASLINIFDPEELVIGGGVSEAGETLLAPIRETASARVLPGVGTSTTIRAARFKSWAGAIGAGLLAASAAGASADGKTR
jgi:glucokinase